MTPLLPHIATALLAWAAPAPYATVASRAAPRAVEDTAGALAVERGWWRAFALADTAYLGARSAPALSLTLSSGRTHDRVGMLREAATHTNGARLGMRWSEEVVRFPAPHIALVSSRMTATLGAASTDYRYLTVLERRGGAWQVAAAQSTREAAFSPRTYAAAAATLADFAGAYHTPRGLALRVAVRDSALVMVEPSGSEVRLEPVGPGLFELPALSPVNGVVRLLFARDPAGRVASLSQLVPSGVTTFPRLP
jgi:hypothetical protein